MMAENRCGLCGATRDVDRGICYTCRNRPIEELTITAIRELIAVMRGICAELAKIANPLYTVTVASQNESESDLGADEKCTCDEDSVLMPEVGCTPDEDCETPYLGAGMTIPQRSWKDIIRELKNSPRRTQINNGTDPDHKGEDVIGDQDA